MGAAALAFLLRLLGDRSVAPFDDLYHLKRIRWSAAHFPHVLEFDLDRGIAGAFVPWPPLYDLSAGLIARLLGEGAIVWIPPVVTSILVGLTVWVVGRLSAIPLACAPFLVVASSVGDIDHHFLEPFLVLGIAGATVLVMRGRSGIPLAMAICAALFVQTALIIAAGLSFVCLWWFRTKNCALPFGAAAVVIGLYRITRPDAYPDTPWFLGWTHAALLAAAAIALIPRNKIHGLAAGALFVALIPGVFSGLLAGSTFFGRDPWLATIGEFQPAWRPLPRLMNYLAGLAAGAIAAVMLLRRRPELATMGMFTLAYIVLTIPTRRFSTISTVLAIVAGVLLLRVRWSVVLAAAVVLIPPMQLIAWKVGARETSPAPYAVAHFLRDHPTPGRVLAPWSYGHLINVIGERPVIIDNFGTMADPDTFWRAQSALDSRDDAKLRAFCEEAGVAFVVLENTPWKPRGFVPVHRDGDLVVFRLR